LLPIDVLYMISSVLIKNNLSVCFNYLLKIIY